MLLIWLFDSKVESFVTQQPLNSKTGLQIPGDVDKLPLTAQKPINPTVEERATNEEVNIKAEYYFGGKQA